MANAKIASERPTSCRQNRTSARRTNQRRPIPWRLAAPGIPNQPPPPPLVGPACAPAGSVSALSHHASSKMPRGTPLTSKCFGIQTRPSSEFGLG
jgi:hypothetical protein